MITHGTKEKSAVPDAFKIPPEEFQSYQLEEKGLGRRDHGNLDV